MKKRILWAGIVGAAAVLITGGILASNMGFKLNMSLVGPQGAPATTGTNLVALPFNQQTSLTSVANLLADISPCPASNVNLISRFVRSADAVSFYSCLGGDLFTLTPGDGYFVQMDLTQSYITVGSHDPSATINLLGPQGAPATTGTNPYAYPYHSVSATVAGLLTEVSPCSPGPSSVNLISRFVRSADAVSFYNCLGGDLFGLVPGDAYLIQVNTDVSFVPAHY